MPRRPSRTRRAVTVRRRARQGEYRTVDVGGGAAMDHGHTDRELHSRRDEAQALTLGRSPSTERLSLIAQILMHRPAHPPRTMHRANSVSHVPLLQHILPARLRAGMTRVVVALLLLVSATASAQQYRIDILVDARLRGPAEVFLEDLRGLLAGEAREVVQFEPIFVSDAELGARVLDNHQWPDAELAILSSTALTGSTRSSALAAFDMPFVFPDTASVIDLQRSPAGLAGLSRMDEQGMVGLVYLNAGTTLIASRIELDEPEDLQRMRVAISPQDDPRTLELLGGVPMTMDPARIESALTDDDIEATFVNSGDPRSWALPDGGHLVTNSIQAQVGVVLAVNSNWYEIPFIYRAMIGDAAIAASTRRDRWLVESEQTLRERLSPVTFQAEQTSRAIDSWIEQQPERRRDAYTRALDDVQSFSAPRPRTPADQQSRGAAGRIYFATTREDTESSELKYRFGDVRTDTIKCGEISYQYSQEELATADVGSVMANNADCEAYLNDVLQWSMRTLIFVHGFNNRFWDATERAMKLKNNLGAESEVVLWSWPSRRDAVGSSYLYDRDSAQGVALQLFKELLNALGHDADTSSSLDILAHSMGGQHATSAAAGLSSSGNSPHLRNLVLAAPDIPTDEFGFVLDEIQCNAGRVTLYASGRDWALRVSERLSRYSRVGMGGEDIFVDARLESINVDGSLNSLNHSYVFEDERVLQDMVTLLLTDVGAEDRGLQRRRKAPWHYWELP